MQENEQIVAAFGRKLVSFENNHRSLIAVLIILVTSLELWGMLHNAFVTPDPISRPAQKALHPVSFPRRDWADIGILLTCFDPGGNLWGMAIGAPRKAMRLCSSWLAGGLHGRRNTQLKRNLP
jgi:hypothetical protein